MLAIAYEITSSTVTPRTHRTLMRRLNRQLLARQRDVNFPKHFENRPETRPGGAYNYEPRTKRYQIRKARAKGHQLPNVWTGRTRLLVRANAKITATANGGRLRTSTHFPRNAVRRQELEVVSVAEQKEHAERAGRDYVRLAGRPEYQRKRRSRRRR